MAYNLDFIHKFVICEYYINRVRRDEFMDSFVGFGFSIFIRQSLLGKQLFIISYDNGICLLYTSGLLAAGLLADLSKYI